MSVIFNIFEKRLFKRAKFFALAAALFMVCVTASGCLKESGKGGGEVTGSGDLPKPSVTTEVPDTETTGGGKDSPDGVGLGADVENENGNGDILNSKGDILNGGDKDGEDSPVNDFDVITDAKNKGSSQSGKNGGDEPTANPGAALLGFGINPLTGIDTGLDYGDKRPAAIMINNLKQSLPQVGINQADILYECLVEGGTTRLMMVVMDYEELGAVGSVRSSRDYYIDFAQNHDAIYVHAGGSEDAYTAIKERKISNLDGVNMSLPSTFYRDKERAKTMAVEHTLMTNGEGIVAGIEYRRYRTTLRSGFQNPFSFPEGGAEFLPDGGTARHVIVTYNNTQFPQYIYNTTYNQYTRYQFNGLDHIDGETSEKLRFTNVIILVCPHSSANDDKNHINVDTAGSGKGYYIYGGRYMEIKWSKKTVDSNIYFSDKAGNPLIINRGNTMINIISPSVDRTLVFNYEG